MARCWISSPRVGHPQDPAAGGPHIHALTDLDEVDLIAVEADDRLIEDLRAACEPPTAEQVAVYLAAWRHEVDAEPLPAVPPPSPRQIRIARLRLAVALARSAARLLRAAARRHP